MEDIWIIFSVKTQSDFNDIDVKSITVQSINLETTTLVLFGPCVLGRNFSRQFHQLQLLEREGHLHQISNILSLCNIILRYLHHSQTASGFTIKTVYSSNLTQ